jgi:alpha-N-arabinofuranosidase
MLSSWLFAAALGAPANAKPDARIKFDTDRVIGEVHPHVFGSFTEHIGRCIYGGIFDEASELADEDGFRCDVMDAVRNLGVTILRWPGGNFVSGYDWYDGVGPIDQRPARTNLSWRTFESNRFGTDEFLRYCEKLGVEPYICVNLGLGSIQDAARWVEYCNEPGRTYWSEQRRKNGRDKPWAVKYWGLGNEIDGHWQLGHKNAEDYAKFALETAKVMKRTDHTIKLIACGSSNSNKDWVTWNRTVLDALKDKIDYISLHTYIRNKQKNIESYLAQGHLIDKRIEVTEGLIRAAQASQLRPHPVYIAFDEWNVWYRTGLGKRRETETPRELAPPQLEEIYNYEDALFMGAFLNSFLRHAHIVKMANLSQLVNVVAPIITSDRGLFLQTTYFPVAEYAKQAGNVALDVHIESPTYKVRAWPPATRGSTPLLPYLDISCTYNTQTRALYLNVLNRSKDRNIKTNIESQSGPLTPSVTIWQLHHPNLNQTHTFGDDRKVRPNVQTVQSAAGETFEYTFPPSSLTILRLTLE